MMNIFLAITLFFSAQISFAQVDEHVFVGNPGDGIKVDGKIYLRDLVENGTYKNPYFGTNKDSKIEAFVQQWIAKNPDYGHIGIDMDLLTRKLSDLSRVQPGFGLMVGVVMVNLTPALSENLEELIRQPGDVPPLNSVQLAARTVHVIYIARSAWSQLDSANRIALLLHEAIFSMEQVQCDSSNDCFQSATDTRQLIGNLFKENHDPALSLKALVLKDLSVEDTDKICTMPALNLTIGLPGSEANDSSREVSFDFKEGESYARMANFVKSKIASGVAADIPSFFYYTRPSLIMDSSNYWNNIATNQEHFEFVSVGGPTEVKVTWEQMSTEQGIRDFVSRYVVIRDTVIPYRFDLDLPYFCH